MTYIRVADETLSPFQNLAVSIVIMCGVTLAVVFTIGIVVAVFKAIRGDFADE